MSKAYSEAMSICNTIKRNGNEAYIINPSLQQSILGKNREQCIDIATDMSLNELKKIFPQLQEVSEKQCYLLVQDDMNFCFYHTQPNISSDLETSIIKLTPRLIQELKDRGEYLPKEAFWPDSQKDTTYSGFADWDSKEIRLIGLPEETLQNNYLLGFRALRFAANFNLPIEANSWTAILRNVHSMLDFCSVADIMDEWRKVDAENLWYFVQLLFDAQILHGLIPEVAALSRIKQINADGQEGTVLGHSLKTMHYYTEQLPFDWFGTWACMLHDVGKLHTAEYVNQTWFFFQHHVIGAKIARQILRRLAFMPEDIDLISHLVRYHKRFDYMLTEKGIRRFKALDEYPRLIELTRANIQARQGNYTAFNHNMKYLERADIPEEMTEPLLDGNRIMELAGLKPGPMVGVIREALLKAQISGEVTNESEAAEYVRNYRKDEGPQTAA